jgi:hypothetical protein
LPSEPGLKAPANSVTDEPAIAKLKVAEQISPRADRENEAGPAQFAPWFFDFIFPLRRSLRQDT